MAKKRKNKKVKDSIKDGDIKAGLPKGAQYNALKGMGYTPSTRDEHRKGRKDARQNLKREDW